MAENMESMVTGLMVVKVVAGPLIKIVL